MTTPESNNPLSPRPKLADLIALALRAGQEIMAVRDQGVTATTKGDGSPVTIADQRAEAIIEEGLKRLAPNIPMLGEEACEAREAPPLGDLFFCVDPLDGTRGFISDERGEFTVNIALVENQEPIMGVVFAPATGELFAGEPGRAVRGEWNGRTAEPITPLAPISVSAQAPDGIWRCIASRTSGGGQTVDFLEALGPHQCASASSSIKFCRLAEGKADLYPRFGPVCYWDAAAAHAVLSAAGGGVMTLEGAPIRYGVRADHLVPGFVAFASAASGAAARSALTRIGAKSIET